MTTFFVQTKLVFISYRMDTWHPSALPIYRISLSLSSSMHGVYFLKSYNVSKINMEYDSHIPYLNFLGIPDGVSRPRNLRVRVVWREGRIMGREGRTDGRTT